MNKGDLKLIVCSFVAVTITVGDWWRLVEAVVSSSLSDTVDQRSPNPFKARESNEERTDSKEFGIGSRAWLFTGVCPFVQHPHLGPNGSRVPQGPILHSSSTVMATFLLFSESANALAINRCL